MDNRIAVNDSRPAIEIIILNPGSVLDLFMEIYDSMSLFTQHVYPNDGKIATRQIKQNSTETAILNMTRKLAEYLGLISTVSLIRANLRCTT